MKKLRNKTLTGLVVGKFYPPHKGHKFLIDTAAAHSDKVILMVVENPFEKIPGKLRAEWLREIHPNAEVVCVKDIMDDDNSEAWAKYTIEKLGFAPDVVFTSEDYGDSYSKFLGSRHILVDKERKHFPVSATMVRKDFFANWEYLEPPVKAYFAKRIVVLGAESTGTTTMAKALAERFKTNWVPEFGRTYAEGKMYLPNYSQWKTDEFIYIANRQNELENELARTANKFLICDTDSFATSIWHERYMGFMSQEVEKLSEDRKHDLYLLTDVDIPFVQDGTRDGEHIRLGMHRRFIEELIKHKKTFVVLSGTRKERLEKAAEACDKILGRNTAL